MKTMIINAQMELWEDELGQPMNEARKRFVEDTADHLIANGVVLVEPLELPSWEEAKEKDYKNGRFLINTQYGQNTIMGVVALKCSDNGQYKEFNRKYVPFNKQGYAEACQWLQEQRIKLIQELAGGKVWKN